MWTFFKRSPHVCKRGSPYAYGNPCVQNYAYGDSRLDCPYRNISRMHTVSDWNIPVCIWALRKSPCAYGDYVSCDPCMQTGISVIPICIRGLILIPICIRGLCVMRSPYAYGDLWYPRMHTGIDLDHHMHMGIAWHIISSIPIHIRGLISILVCIQELQGVIGSHHGEHYVCF